MPDRTAKHGRVESDPGANGGGVQPLKSSAAPPPGRKFPCPKCGAKLDFDPASQHLACPYCGHKEEIAVSAEEVKERDFDEYLQRLAGKGTQIEGRSTQVRCTGCGGTVLLEDKVATDQCPFCGTHLESKPEAANDMIQPEGVLPFAIDERNARQRFNAWVEGLWFAPSELKKLANLGQIQGVYLPYWTYDSMTYSHYTGERGDNYTETEVYTDMESYTETQTDSNGNTVTVTKTRPVTKTRQVVKIRWWPVSGRVHHFFDDVLICASHTLTDQESHYLAPWDLEKVEGFQPQFLSSFKTERYGVDLQEGFGKAKVIMDGHIHTLCQRDIGGDHQRVHSVRTQYMGVTFKHLLLPAWMGVYRYQNQPYRVLVNARTGRVFGRRPYSVMKITMLVLFILAVVGIIALFVWWNSQRGGGNFNQAPAPGQFNFAPAPTPLRRPLMRIAIERDSLASRQLVQRLNRESRAPAQGRFLHALPGNRPRPPP